MLKFPIRNSIFSHGGHDRHKSPPVCVLWRVHLGPVFYSILSPYHREWSCACDRRSVWISCGEYPTSSKKQREAVTSRLQFTSQGIRCSSRCNSGRFEWNQWDTAVSLPILSHQGLCLLIRPSPVKIRRPVSVLIIRVKDTTSTNSNHHYIFSLAPVQPCWPSQDFKMYLPKPPRKVQISHSLSHKVELFNHLQNTSVKSN